MFIYLAKKITIAIPEPVPLASLSWNREYGWIACGGRQGGVLKVLKLDGGDKLAKGAQSNLSMNQTLEGHSGSVQVITWNEHYRKLTTSDEYGLIIVWVLHQGAWCEEMINNRNKSVVKDMKWNADGQCICIVYEDGAVIVGGVDGRRLWGKPLNIGLAKVEWAPNGKYILFGTVNGELHMYDSAGNFMSKIPSACLEGSVGPQKLIGMEWYNGANGYIEPGCPCLAICYENGRMQIMRHETDENPILVDTMMTVVRIQWNQHGTVLAVAGAQGEVNVVQFYNPFGEHMRTLKIPGKELKSASWEGGGLRLALAVDHFIYFANVRPDYKWGYFSNTVVYAFTKPERSEHCVVFWDTKMNGRVIKYVKNLTGINASGDHCVLTTKADDNSGQFVLILCNSIGTPIDSKYIDIEPIFLDMTDTHIVVASRECVYVWAYRTSNKHVDAGKKSKRDEKIFHVDDQPSAKDSDVAKFKKAKLETQDPICCISLSNSMLMVGRESGTLNQYGVPRVSLDMKHLLNCRPDFISLNCDSSRVAIIDISGVLSFFDPSVTRVNPETGETEYGEHNTSFERKDVWDFRWATDNPNLFAMMERNYMYIFRDLDPEEPISSTGFICQFEDLQVRSVNLDEIMKDPERPTKENLTDKDIKSLRDTRVLLEKVSIDDAYEFIEQNPHPRLWRLLAESALADLHFEISDKAFVRCHDFQGIEFVKRLQKLDDPSKQEAEVATYFGRFEDAEKIYLDMDRRDLAVNLRIKLGDWFRVVQLLKGGGGGNDALLERAWNEIGNYYADRQRWNQAVKYYKQGRDQERLADCLYRLEDYVGLEEMVVFLPENDPLLAKIAEKFATVGLCSQAVDAYTKTGMIKESINVCVSLNQWDQAVSLAKRHNVSEIDTLLAKYAAHLLSKNREIEAIELYRKANHYLDAAKLLFQVAANVGGQSNPLRAKKIYVLAALQVEAYHNFHRGSDSTRAALDGLLSEDTQSQAQSKLIDNAWRGAEAFHFLLLAQRQLNQRQYAPSLFSAMRLTEYDDILDPVLAYSVLALAAIANQCYGICSRAFIKLESLPGLSEKQRAAYEALSMQIFTKHQPVDSDIGVQALGMMNSAEYSSSASTYSIVTGRPILSNEYWLCSVCKHRAAANEIMHLSTCPLCHAVVE
eukprot:m.76510 g.76510  ORF g.76510 m.76510 type:complete len:1153 (+) comp8114_c0_seq1:167-3625(+)